VIVLTGTPSWPVQTLSVPVGKWAGDPGTGRSWQAAACPPPSGTEINCVATQAARWRCEVRRGCRRTDASTSRSLADLSVRAGL